MATILILPIDVLNIFVAILPIKDALRLISSHRYFKNIRIFNLSSWRINDEALHQKKYEYIYNLDITCNMNITSASVSCLTRLTKLNISHGNSFYQEHLNCISNLVYLNIDYNKNITNIAHLTTLTHLDMIGTFNINNINNLTNLTKLNLYGNKKITNISDLTNLRKLNIGGWGSSVNQSSINKLTNLTFLKMRNNQRIDSVSHLTCLIYLNVIDAQSKTTITNLISLKTLLISDKSSNLSFFG